MNTRASVAYGWGVLCLAGGGAYYFAKRSINSDREERAAAIEEQRRHKRERLRTASTASQGKDPDASPVVAGETKKRAPNAEKLGHGDPAPVEHAHGGVRGNADPVPVQHTQEAANGKFEAKEPFRSRKGDRFS